MSSYSSSSSASALSPVSSTRYQASAEESGLWRARSLRSDASASRQVRHVACRGRGSGTRHLDWEHRERSSNLSETQSSLPGSQTLRREDGYAEGHDGRHIAIQVSSDDRNASKLRGQSGAHNEAGVSRALRPSGGPRLQSPSSQAHQSYHADVGYSASNRRLLTRLGPAQVSPATHTAAPLPPSSPLSRSPPFPLTPPRHRSPAVDKLSCTPLSHSSSASSLASSRLPALSLGPPFDQPTTPSPSPRSQRTRFNRSTSPPPSSILRSFAVQRARPTLAMSIQIHAPSPVLSMRSRSPAPVPSSSARGRSQSRRRDSCERPSSPLSHHAQLPPLQRSPMTRPSSRSERLLRDTLRRAEEHDRMLNVHPLPSPKVIGASLPGSPFLSPTGVLTMPNNVVPANSHSSRRHSRRNTASSIATSASCDDCERLYEPPVAVDQDDEYEDVEERNGGQWRGQVGGAHPSSPSHHYQAMPMQPGLSRNRSLTSRSGDAKRTFSEANTKAQMAYGTPTSPTPVRTRSTTSASRRHSHSHAQSHSHSNSRTSFDGEHPVRSSHQSSTVVTPHDAVLRSRLEGVLRNAKEQERREKSSERRYKDAGSSNGSGSGSRNSMASSRNLSAEGDLFFGAGGESSVTSLSSVDVKPSATAVAPSRTSLSSTRSAPTGFSFPARSPPMSNMPLRPPGTPSRQRASPTSSHSSGVSPLTPPPSPPFNARTAAEQCKAMDGYVSFATIEGLGVPEGYEDDDNEDDDGNGRGRWWQWLTIASKSRDRSASIHSGISR